MLRKLPIYAICLFAAAPFACTKSEDDLRPAQRAAGGLMPDNDPKFEAEYVADQSQVKLVAPRTVSYEPLDTFRGKTEPAARGDDASGEAEPSKPTARAAARGAPSAGPSGGGGNFWSRVGMKALMGGGAAPPGPRPTSPGKPAPKGDEPTADDKDTAEEEEAEADDEEPAEDEETESDEEESEEEGSDEEPKEKDSLDEKPTETDSNRG